MEFPFPLQLKKNTPILNKNYKAMIPRSLIFICILTATWAPGSILMANPFTVPAQDTQTETGTEKATQDAEPTTGTTSAQDDDNAKGKAPAKEDNDKPEEVKDFTKGLKKFEGFYNFYWDNEKGTVYLELEKFDEPFLFVNSLATGLGSNPVGLDRGQIGSTRVVRFHRIGPKVILRQDNLRYRASSENPDERAAVEQSFASSNLWVTKITEEQDGKVYIDLTDLLMRDWHGIARTLKGSDQGSFSLDKSRSLFWLDRTKAFVQNCEFEVELTFNSDSPGRLVRETAASGNSVSLRQHFSMVQLPDNNYKPRKHDPRVGSFSVSFQDYSSPIDQSLTKRYIARHRLQKKNPGAAMSEAVEPIVYYLDRGVPEPVKSALLEGARWWNSAFEKAGFKNAFQVEMLPKGADPMDVRYNVIQWVHRSTRGWSYGQSVIDPRTGEIIKGHVLLGSLRVRQDHLLVTGLRTPTAASCSCCGIHGMPEEFALALQDDKTSPLQVSLARIRQLSAHEVGHTIGFSHNFAASTYGDRASVMDYPAPRVKIRNGKLDLSDAYGVGVGIWDDFCVKYTYTEYEQNESAELEKLVKDAIAKGLIYMTDSDSRSPAAAHPLSNLWDNGSDPIKQLEHLSMVRKMALSKLDPSRLRNGEPLSNFEILFAPVYLHHRYQVAAVGKMIGGSYYTYAVKGDSQTPSQNVTVSEQKKAVDALIKTIAPKFLAIPQNILDAMPPKSVSSLNDRERFSTNDGITFDQFAAVKSAVDMTLGELLNPRRCSRLESQLNEQWGLAELHEELTREVWRSENSDDKQLKKIRWTVQLSHIDYLINLAKSSGASEVAKALTLDELEKIKRYLQPRAGRDSEGAVYRLAIRKIDLFLENRQSTTIPSPQFNLPPGSPIGSKN